MEIGIGDTRPAGWIELNRKAEIGVAGTGRLGPIIDKGDVRLSLCDCSGLLKNELGRGQIGSRAGGGLQFHTVVVTGCQGDRCGTAGHAVAAVIHRACYRGVGGEVPECGGCRFSGGRGTA